MMSNKKQAKMLRKELRKSPEYQAALEEVKKAKAKAIADLNKNYGGLVPEKRLKRKDRIFRKAYPKTEEEALGAPRFEHLGRLEQIAQSSLVKPSWYQGKDFSCVVVSATFTNNFFSIFNSKNDIRMAWQDLWYRVPKYPQGTKLSEVLQVLKNEGVRGSDGRIYKINNYLKLDDRSPAEIYRALQKAPVIIGFWTDEAGLTSNHTPHEIVAVDVNPEGTHLQCLDWQQPDKQEYVAIPITIPLINAAVIYDLPDGVEVKSVRLGWGGFFKNFLK